MQYIASISDVKVWISLAEFSFSALATAASACSNPQARSSPRQHQQNSDATLLARKASTRAVSHRGHTFALYIKIDGAADCRCPVLARSMTEIDEGAMVPTLTLISPIRSYQICCDGKVFHIFSNTFDIDGKVTLHPGRRSPASLASMGPCFPASLTVTENQLRMYKHCTKTKTRHR